MKYPLFKVHVDVDDVLTRLRDVFSSGFINEGVYVTEFRDRLKEHFQHEHVTVTNSCTSSLVMALKLSGVVPGDEVITTSMTCVATNAPIMFANAKIVWADIDPHTGNISVESVRGLITKNTKAVICVDWAGLPCELEELWALCKKNGIKLIQDAAHGFGSTLHDKPLCHFADYTCYSFQAIKHLTSGDGGAIICDDPQDFQRANAMKWFGFDRDKLKDREGNWKKTRWDADIDIVGGKFSMNNISAVMGLSNLKYIDELVSKHKSNASVYREIFNMTGGTITSLNAHPDSDPAYWVYTVLFDKKIDRDKVSGILKKKGIHNDLIHVPNHDYSCFIGSYCELEGTDYFASHQLSLPCGWWLSKDDVEFIAHSTIGAVEESWLV